MTLEERWKKRIRNQAKELIGSTEPGDGNGYHDRLSFDIINRGGEDSSSEIYSHWLHTVYFRDLAQRLNPIYSLKKDNLANSFNFINASEQYQNTFYKYISRNSGWRKESLFDVLGKWGQSLVHDGRLVIEFVSWYDNEDHEFYGFELKVLDSRSIEIKKDKIILSAFDYSAGHKRICTIPLNKCIIVEWPVELGGYKEYNEISNAVIALGDKLQGLGVDPALSLKLARDWDFLFNKYLSKWGTNHPLEGTNEFYQQYCYLRFWGTAVYLFNSLLLALQQVVDILNGKLNESAILEFQSDRYKIDRYQDVQEGWLAGRLTFKEVSSFMFDN